MSTDNTTSKRPRLDGIGAGSFSGTRVRDCLALSAKDLSARADEVAEIVATFGVPTVSEADRAHLPGQGYDQQSLLAEANAGALADSEGVQKRSGVTPAMLEGARRVQGELLRAQAGAEQLREDAEDGERFLQAAQGHGCKQILGWLENELRTATPAEQQKLQGLSAPLVNLWERLQAQKAREVAKEERRLRPLMAQVAEAQADAQARETLAAIGRGEVPGAEAITQAAQRLGDGEGEGEGRRRRR